MSMLEPFFQGRSVDTGAIGSSLTPPLRGDGSFGSMPTASVPGKGCSWTMIPGLNSARLLARSSLNHLMNPWASPARARRWSGSPCPAGSGLTPKGLGTILRMRISITSPGSAPFT